MTPANNPFRSTRFRVAVMLAIASCFGVASLAQAITHKATLDGAQEVPPVNTPASGFAKLDLDKNAMTLRIVLAFGNLLGEQTAAHIHGPAPPGVNAGVLLGLPVGIFDQTFNIDAATMDAIQNGLAYINVHTTAFPGGEIRGQIGEQPVSVETSTFSRIKALYRN
jgi:hypothetical protein